jgi:Lrp/AsnC family leucine-responsive transcriptional regulator
MIAAIFCQYLPMDCTIMAGLKLDATDRRILQALQGDSRLSNVDLADKAGLSPSPCLRRVKRLEVDGVIDGYIAFLDVYLL